MSLAAWRSATSLLAYPRLFAALTVGAVLLVAGLSAYPLFLSSAASDVIGSGIRTGLVTRHGVGVGYKSTNIDLFDPLRGGERVYDAMDAAFRRLIATSPDLGRPIQGVLGPNVTVSSDAETADARLIASTDAVDHVRPLAGRPEDEGAWLPDLVATAIGAKPGETVTLHSQEGAAVTVDVAGVYSSLYAEPRRGYWHQWAGDIFPSLEYCTDPCPDPAVPPQFILLDHQSLREAMAELGDTTATVAWHAPLATTVGVTLERARRVEAFAERVRLRLSQDSTRIGRLFNCCHERGISYHGLQETRFYSLMRDVVTRAEQRIAAVSTPGRVLQVTAVLVALGVLAAAGAFAVAARPTETRLRFARGASPAAIGLRAGAEAALPCLLGAAVGLAIALLIVRVLGPRGGLEGRAIASASSFAIGGALAASLSIGVVAAVSFVTRFRLRRAKTSLVAGIPWELVLLGLAWLTFRRLNANGPIESIGELERPRQELLLFPLLFITGGAALAARGTRRLARMLPSRWGDRLVAHLAIRRLSRAPALAVGLVAAAALSLGLLIHSQTVVQSLRTTIDTRARIFVGSDLAAWVRHDTAVPEGFPLPATKVTRRAEPGTFAGTSIEFDLLAIDSETFSRAAFWRDEFSPVPLEAILNGLGTRMDPLPVAVAGEAPTAIQFLEMTGATTPVEVVARAEVFPGMVGRRPLVIVDAGALDRAVEGGTDPLNHTDATSKIWVRGGSSEAVAALSLLPIEPYYTLTVEQVTDLPATKALIESLIVLNALGLAAAALVVAGILMFLQARQRGQLVAYGLTVRMGLTSVSYRRSIALELAGMLAAALVAGVITGVVAGSVVNGFVDPLGNVPPSPRFRLPLMPVLLLSLGLAALAWIGAWWASRTAARAKFGEVMRVAET
jgi:putative ABC transport system permease protein